MFLDRTISKSGQLTDLAVARNGRGRWNQYRQTRRELRRSLWSRVVAEFSKKPSNIMIFLWISDRFAAPMGSPARSINSCVDVPSNAGHEREGREETMMSPPPSIASRPLRRPLRRFVRAPRGCCPYWCWPGHGHGHGHAWPWPCLAMAMAMDLAIAMVMELQLELAMAMARSTAKARHGPGYRHGHGQAWPWPWPSPWPWPWPWPWQGMAEAMARHGHGHGHGQVHGHSHAYRQAWPGP